jgi:hypothetical protein
MLRRQIAPAGDGRRSLTASSCFALHTNTHMRALDLTSFRRFEPNKDCASTSVQYGRRRRKGQALLERDRDTENNYSKCHREHR